MDTNFYGAVWVCQAALPHLRARGSGHIVQISTVEAVGSLPLFGMYTPGNGRRKDSARHRPTSSAPSVSPSPSRNWAGSPPTGPAPVHVSPPRTPPTPNCAPRSWAPPTIPIRTPRPPAAAPGLQPGSRIPVARMNTRFGRSRAQ
ncbi:SDR family NAD(P)-dependent oxidoreductase [Nocardia sp. NPDC050799]|uniref:SDR family NAD(P)-dependent oxidoreductase n=1 Tax=Nocardia sp. NPDC050799 TaxID=3154842 RepID=UPI0033E220EB